MGEKQPRKSGDTVFPIITLSVTMETSGWIWPNFKLIQDLMYVIITCKYEKDSIKNSREKVETSFFPFYAYGDFFRRSRAANSAVSGPSRLKFKLVRALMHVIITFKYEKDRMKNRREKVETPFSPLQPYGRFLLPWKPEFWSDLIQNIIQPFPQPNDASDKIWFRSTDWFQRYSCLKVWTHGRMDGRTDERRLDWYTTTTCISSPCEPSAQVS